MLVVRSSRSFGSFGSFGLPDNFIQDESRPVGLHPSDPAACPVGLYYFAMGAGVTCAVAVVV